MRSIRKCFLAFSFGAYLMFIMSPIVISASDTPSSWATEQVNLAIAEDLIPQNLQSNYNQAITRAEFCNLVVTVYEKLKGEISGDTAFTDTSDLNVRKLASIGIVSGVGENKFNPEGTLTREQAAVILSRLSDVIGEPFASYTPTFTDTGNIAAWAIDSVGRVQAAGIMNGIGNNTFLPKGMYTREQSILTILRTYALIWRTGSIGGIEPIPMQVTQKAPENAPSLNVSLISNNTPVQNFQAERLSGSWVILNENGNVAQAQMSDSCHPLQISDYSKITFHFSEADNKIELKFNNDYPPQFFKVQRWDVKYAGADVTEALNKGEPVEVNKNTINVHSDGHDYVYEVYAIWPVGSSYYAFRTDGL